MPDRASRTTATTKAVVHGAWEDGSPVRVLVILVVVIMASGSVADSAGTRKGPMVQEWARPGYVMDGMMHMNVRFSSLVLTSNVRVRDDPLWLLDADHW